MTRDVFIKNSRKRFPPLLSIGVALSLLFGACGKENPVDSQAPEYAEFVRSQPISFQTQDGFLITGTWFRSSRGATIRPAVILVHMWDQTHAQWVPFVPDLASQGYHVLAFDIRGHGQSTQRNGVYAPRSQFGLDDFDRMPLDVAGAITWLKAQEDVDPSRIAVLGADIGANIAYVSSGTFLEVKTSVAISPLATGDQTVLWGADVPDFRPRSILFLSSFGDGYTYSSSEILAARTAEPVRVTGFQGTANGIFLLTDEGARALVFSWLRENL